MVANLIKCIYNPIIFFFYRYYINIVYINPGLVTRNSKLTSNFDWASLFTLMAKYIVYHWHSTMVDVEEWLSEYLDKPLPHNYVCWPSSKRLQIPKKQWYSHAWQIILFSSKSHIWSNNVLTWSTHTHTHTVYLGCYHFYTCFIKNDWQDTSFQTSHSRLQLYVVKIF